MTTVVTGWTGRGYDALGEQFVRTFRQHWTFDVDAIVYSDAGSRWYDLNECDGLADFRHRHKDNPAANGITADGHSFRFDAVKFATQLFIPEAAAKHLPDGEIMVWFDADVVTRRPVPAGFIEGLMGNWDCIYLGRPPKWSEIGFWAVLLSPLVREFLTFIADLYRTDKVFELKETHSAFVWDVARKEFERRGMWTHSLTKGGRSHVWPESPLGRYTQHLKGKRKNSLLMAA